MNRNDIDKPRDLTSSEKRHEILPYLARRKENVKTTKESVNMTSNVSNRIRFSSYQFWIPKVLLIIFIALITWYTYINFFIDPRNFLNLDNVLFYFLPSMVMLILLKIGWRHRKFEGIAILLISFIFLGIYHVYVGVAAFIDLLVTGALFLIDGD